MKPPLGPVPASLIGLMASLQAGLPAPVETARLKALKRAFSLNKAGT